jgi:hypothetical protein
LLDGERGGALVPNDVITAHCMLLNGVSSATLTVAPAAKAGGTARAGSSSDHVSRILCSCWSSKANGQLQQKDANCT